MKYVIVSLFLLYTLNSYNQSRVTYSDYNNSIYEEKTDSIKCKQEYKNGMRNGKYRSWYSNNELRCEGGFENNIKKGKWKIFDKNGVLRVEMNFNKNGLAINYKTWNKNSDLIFKKTYNTKISQNFTLDYNKFQFSEPDLIYSKRVNGIIENNVANNKLFKDDYLNKKLIKLIKNNNLEIFDYEANPYGLLSEKRKLINFKEVENAKILRYEIEIIYFMTTKSEFTQKKTTFITPIFEVENTKTIKPYMIFMNYSDITDEINNSNFWIYKEENIKDQLLTKYYKNKDKEYLSQKVFNDILEYEIESWIK